MMIDLVAIEPVAVQMSFDYDSLDSNKRLRLQGLDARFDIVLKRTGKDIGEIILEAESFLSPEEAKAWVKSKGLSRTTIWRCKQLANGRVFQNETTTIEQPVEPVEEVPEVRLKRTTNEEKRKVVEDFIAETPNWQEMSNRAIARICGVSEPLVRTIRKELLPEPIVAGEEVEDEPAIPTSLDFYHEHDTVEELEYIPDEYPQDFISEPIDDTEPYIEDDRQVEPEPEPEMEQKPEPVRVSNVPAALLSSESNEWYTPKIYIDAAHELMGGIDLDPASNAIANEIVKAAKYYDITDSGLDHSWEDRVWLNPPYGTTNGRSNQEIWTQKLIEECGKGVTEAVLLVNSSTGAKWFQPLYQRLICFTDHRIRFYNADSDQPTKENALVYFGSQREKFIEIFSRFGTVIERAK